MQDLTITNAVVFDGVAAPPPGRFTVRVRGGRIAEVAAAEAPVTPDETVIDAGGMTLMPGLIDAHFHCNSPAVDVAAADALPASHMAQYARRYLEDMLLRGFTTVRDAGGADVGLVRALEEGLITGPRLLVAGKALSQTGGHGDLRKGVSLCGCDGYSGSLSCVVDGAEDVRRHVRNLLRLGAHHVKLMVSGGVLSPTDPIWMDQYTDEEIRAAVTEAARWRTYVMAHALTDSASRRCAVLGVRSVEHGIGVRPDTARLMAERGTFVTPTLGMLHWLLEGAVPLPPVFLDKARQVGDQALEALNNCHEAGVGVGLGTDLLGPLHGRETHELVLRAEVSGALETLRSATSVNAELIQMKGELGVIAPGARADLLLVDGDPLMDISVLTQRDRLRLIVRDGAVVSDRLTADHAAVEASCPAT